MTFVSAVLSNSFKSRIASLFSMNLSRLFHCSVIKVLCSLPFSNFYILSDIQVLVNNFFIFLCCRLKRQPYQIITGSHLCQQLFSYFQKFFQDQLSHPMPPVSLLFFFLCRRISDSLLIITLSTAEVNTFRSVLPK